MKQNLKLSEDYVLGGVVGGLADYLEIDVTVLRVIVFALGILTGLIPVVILYLSLYVWLTVKEKESDAGIYTENEAGIKFEEKKSDEDEKDD